MSAGDMDGMAAVFTDEMLEPYTVTATWDELPDALLVRYDSRPPLRTWPTGRRLHGGTVGGHGPRHPSEALSDELGRLGLSKDDLAVHRRGPHVAGRAPRGRVRRSSRRTARAMRDSRYGRAGRRSWHTARFSRLGLGFPRRYSGQRGERERTDRLSRTSPRRTRGAPFRFSIQGAMMGPTIVTVAGSRAGRASLLRSSPLGFSEPDAGSDLANVRTRSPSTATIGSSTARRSGRR